MFLQIEQLPWFLWVRLVNLHMFSLKTKEQVHQKVYIYDSRLEDWVRKSELEYMDSQALRKLPLISWQSKMEKKNAYHMLIGPNQLRKITSTHKQALSSAFRHWAIFNPQPHAPLIFPHLLCPLLMYHASSTSIQLFADLCRPCCSYRDASLLLLPIVTTTFASPQGKHRRGGHRCVRTMTEQGL